MLDFDSELSATYQYIQSLLRAYQLRHIEEFLDLLHKKSHIILSTAAKPYIDIITVLNED